MKHPFPTLAGVLLLSSLAIPVALGQVYYPIPGLVDESTGFMESYAAGGWYRGSAVIARDPKLIYSSAHLFYENGKWATDYYFHRAYHGKDSPRRRDGVSPRGLLHFTSYSSGVRAYGSSSKVAFASDFTILYGNTGFGTAVGWWPLGSPVLRSANLKRVVGYPARIDFTGKTGRSYQHSTEWFDYAARREYGAYHGFDNVSTGPGNSGGPVFVQDENTGLDHLAGILVSGSRKSAGVVALDDSTDAMADSALAEESTTLASSNSGSFEVPDASGSFSSIPLEVPASSGSVKQLKLSLSVTTGRPGDLEIYLKSPGGRIRWIARHPGGTAADLTITGADYSDTFRGCAENGTWEVRMRDVVAGVSTTFQSCSLEIITQ
jgi:subtilisin-like proprotein convertase family protein